MKNYLRLYRPQHQNIINIGKETNERRKEIEKESLSKVPELKKEFKKLTLDAIIDECSPLEN